MTRVGEFVSSELVMRCNSVTRTRIRNTTIRRNDEELNCIGGAHIDQASDGNTATGLAAHTVLPWSKEGLERAQRADPDIGFIMEQLETEGRDKPVWEDVALKSYDVKTLWRQRARLAIRYGLLRRRFETADGLSERWQVVWPATLRTEFLKVAHRGMTADHLGRRRTAVAIQSRAYWPTWSSDLAVFLKKCNPCVYTRLSDKPNVDVRTPSMLSPTVEENQPDALMTTPVHEQTVHASVKSPRRFHVLADEDIDISGIDEGTNEDVDTNGIEEKSTMQEKPEEEEKAKTQKKSVTGEKEDSETSENEDHRQGSSKKEERKPSKTEDNTEKKITKTPKDENGKLVENVNNRSRHGRIIGNMSDTAVAAMRST